MELNESEVWERLARTLSSEILQPIIYYNDLVKACEVACWAAIAKRLHKAVPKCSDDDIDAARSLKHECKKQLFQAAQTVALHELQLHHCRALQAIEKELVRLNMKLDREVQRIDRISQATTCRLEKLSLLRLELDRTEIEYEDEFLNAQIDRNEAYLDLKIQHNEFLRNVALESLVDPYIDVIDASTVQMTFEPRDSYAIYAKISVLGDCEASCIETGSESTPGIAFMKLMLQKETIDETDESSWALNSSLWENCVTPHDIFVHLSTALGRMSTISNEIDLLGEEVNILRDTNSKTVIVVSYREVNVYFERGIFNPIHVDGQISIDEKTRFPNLFR
mmetsp:Transcript_1487/g.2187  ORF Transcript_1487/g.2187 Transcript_1487/m.2187 type:complete len:337 (-) Transcript_1487:29-1039(-)